MEPLHKFSKTQGICPNCESEARECINKGWVNNMRICMDYECKTCGAIYTEFYNMEFEFSETFVDISYVPATNKE
jgi:hypothetical protein